MRKLLVSFIAVCVIFTQFATFGAGAAYIPAKEPSSRAVYLVNSDTGTVLYEKNQDQKVYPASLTKIMTAIIAYKKFSNDLNHEVTVEDSDLTPLRGKDGSTAGFRAGETVTVDELLNCLLIPSGDDAALILARATSGSTDSFVKEMNAEAKKLGARNTHYVNPHGLHDPDHYTTAHDMYLIAKYAMSFKHLADIVDSTSYTLPATNKRSKPTVFQNTNLTIRSASPQYYYKYIKGIKTGSTTPAGACLASYAQNEGSGGTTYYCMVLGGTKGTASGNTAFSDTKNLYKWAFDDFAIKTLVKTSNPCSEVKVRMGVNKDKLMLVPQKQVDALVPISTEVSSDIKLVPHVPSSVSAPVKKGRVLGYADIMLKSHGNAMQKIGTVKLMASDGVELSRSAYLIDLAGRFFRSLISKIVFGLIAIVILLYALLSAAHNNKKRNRSRNIYRTYHKK